MRYTYEITPRPSSLGGGWRLRLQQDGEEVGGGVFPVVPGDAATVLKWWTGLTDRERIEWLDRSAGVTPADAHLALLSEEAYRAAEATALLWLSNHDVDDVKP